MKTDISKKILPLLGFLLGSYVLAVVLQPMFFADRFGAFSRISGVDVSYLKAESAKQKVEDAFADYIGGKIVIGGEIVSASDLIASLDAQRTVDNAILAEERGYFTFSKVRMHRYPLSLNYKEEGITRFLLSAYNKVATVPVDAGVEVSDLVTVLPETTGQRLLLVESKQYLLTGLSDMDGDIDLKIVPQVPSLTAAEAREAVASAEIAVSESVTLFGDGTTYQIGPTDLRNWLKISSSKPKSLLAIETYLPQVSEYYFLDQNKVFLFVDKLAQGVDAPAVNAKLTVANGKVVVATKEQVGYSIDKKDAINQIQLAVVGDKTARLKISTKKPEIRTDNLSELGLSELVSTGWSDFTGSPINRIHNVKTGAAKFDGVLLRPGENVSFNKILGPVDASTGYLPELVILADKTVPEYGGGLCQVSSTAFRAALNAGLPILERHAHAYPVSYYKPFGVDATIYLPSPDLRWQNDTGKYMLIQTRIEGKKLYFDFFGTKKPVKITFSGNDKAVGSVENIEKVTPSLSDLGFRGKNSFTAVFYRHIYDATGKLLDSDKFTSKYDSPDKYPH